MADAELGVVVSVQGASEGAAQLDKFALSAKGAAASTNDLASARAKAESQWANLTGVKTAAAETTKLATATTATAQSAGLMQRAWQAITGVFSGYGRDAEGASINLNHLAGAHGEVAKGMHLVNAIASSTGTSIGGIGQFAMLARGGLAVLAAGIVGTVIVSLERAAESAASVNTQLKNLLGLSGGNNTFNQLKQSTDTANNSLGSYLAGLNAVNRALAEQSTFKTVTADQNAPGGISVSSGLPNSDTTAAARAMSEALQLDQKNATDAGKAVDGYLQSLAKYKGLSADLFHQIEADSPLLSAAISKAYGFGGDLSSQAKFENALKTSPAALQDFLRKVQAMAPDFDKAYSHLTPNVDQGADRLKTSIVKLWSQISDTTVASTAINSLTDAIKDMNTNVEHGIPFWEALNTAISGLSEGTSFEDFQKMLGDLGDKLREIIGLGDINIAIHAPTDTSGFDGFINRLIADLDSLVARAASAAKSVLSYLATIGAQVNAAQIAANTGGQGDYASTQPGVSFDATGLSDASNAIQGYATGGTFKVGGSGAQTPVHFMGTPGEIVSVTPVGGNAGSVFQVGGLGGVDSTLVQFSATPGSTVTITPVGLTAPQSQGLGPVSGLTTHVPGMATLALGGAVVNQASTTTAAAAATAAASANPYSMFGVGSTGEAKIAAWKGNPAGTMSDYVPLSQIYASAKSDAQNFGQAPTQNATSNAYYSQYGIDQYIASGPNAATGASKGVGSSSSQVSPYGAGNFIPDQGGDLQGGGYSDTYYGGSYDPNSDPNNWATYVGDYQTGGSFKVRGGGAPDSKMVAMRLSPDENVVISRPNAGKSDKAMNVTLNINGNISPLAFVAAEAQVKRAARRIFS